ncbi:MAG: hypothetical protein LKG27_00555 [Clostridiaceae bacterium]|jgi:hypothetical protein|nr:hypothetical protein [Clostridiaceae bacterium]
MLVAPKIRFNSTIEGLKKCAKNVSEKCSAKTFSEKENIIIVKHWYEPFLPKRMRKTSKITFDSTSHKKLEEEFFEGNVSVKHLYYNASGDIVSEHTFDPKTNTKTIKIKNGEKYSISKWINKVLRYEEKTGGGLNLKDIEPTGKLADIELPKDNITKIYYDKSGEKIKQEIFKQFKDIDGKIKKQIYLSKEGKDTTIFNDDGSINSTITYSRRKNESRGWDKNPYFEQWTYKNNKGENIGQVTYYNDKLIHFNKKTSDSKEYVMDKVRLKGKTTTETYKDGSQKQTTKYFDGTIYNKEFDAKGQEIFSRKFDPHTNITTEINFKNPTIKETRTLKNGVLMESYKQDIRTGQTIYGYKYSEQTKSWQRFTKIYDKNKYINEYTKCKEGQKPETRYFDEKHQRINSDGTKYQYKTEAERDAEWFKQERESSNSTGSKGGSSKSESSSSAGSKSGNDKSGSSSSTGSKSGSSKSGSSSSTGSKSGSSKSGSSSSTGSKGNSEKINPKRPESSIGNEKEFINKLDNFLASKKRKLNDNEYEYLAKILKVSDVQVLKDLSNSENKEAKKLYRQLCTKYHPDKCDDDKIFKIIQNLHSRKK